MKPKKTFYLSEERLAAYSRMNRKRIEAIACPGPYGIWVFPAIVDPKEIAYIKQCEHDAGYDWDDYEGWVSAKYNPFDTSSKDEIEDWELSKGAPLEEKGFELAEKLLSEGEGDPFEMAKMFAKLEAAESQREAKGDNGEGEGNGEGKSETEKDVPQDYSKEDLVGKEIVWKKGTWQENKAGTKVAKQFESGGINTDKGYGFTVAPDGTVKTDSAPSGAIKGSPADKQQNGKQSEKKKKEEKWTKIVINKCPLCKGEGQSYVKVDGKRPDDPMEWLDYTENNCGCEALKKVFAEGTYGAIKRSEEPFWTKERW